MPSACGLCWSDMSSSTFLGRPVWPKAAFSSAPAPADRNCFREIEFITIRLSLKRIPNMVVHLVRLAVFSLVIGVLPAEVVWSVSTPEQQGFEKAKLDAVRDNLAAHSTKSFLVARNGSIVYEWYAPGNDKTQKHYTASLAKSLVGGMSLLVAMQDGRIRPDDPAWKYIPAWKDDPLRSKITIRHLATHSSGIQDAHQDGVTHENLPGWMGDFWKRKPDPFTISLYQAPVIYPPGTRYHYSNTGMAALAYAVTASLRGAPEPDIRTVLEKRILTPIGIPQTDWSIGYGESTSLDGLKVYANWGGGGFTPRATARVGQLLLQRGMWDGRKIAGAEWIEKMVA